MPIHKSAMNRLEQYTLLKYCRKWGLDPYEIDSTLTYWENKEHLKSIVKMLSKSLDMFEITRMESELDQYVAEHALTYYAACQMYGETKSDETGKPDTSPQQFSLRTMTNVGFSLRSLIQRKP